MRISSIAAPPCCWLSQARRQRPPTLKVAVLMGVRSDICVPVSTVCFVLPLGLATPDRAQGLRLAQAAGPDAAALAGRAATGRLGLVWISGAKALAVKLDDGEVDLLSLIADAERGASSSWRAAKSPDGNLVLLPLLGEKVAAMRRGKPVRLIFHDRYGSVLGRNGGSRSAGSTAAGD